MAVIRVTEELMRQLLRDALKFPEEIETISRDHLTDSVYIIRTVIPGFRQDAEVTPLYKRTGDCFEIVGFRTESTRSSGDHLP